MNVNDRLKLVRKELGLKQREFSEQVGLTQSAVSRMESPGGSIIDRNIRLICDKFSINESWLRTGAGEKFTKTNDELLRQLHIKYNLTEDDDRLLKVFLSFNASERKQIIDFAKYFSQRFAKDEYDAETERLLEQLRREREAEKRAVQESLQEQSEKRA